jgi:hypothetical protein
MGLQKKNKQQVASASKNKLTNKIYSNQMPKTTIIKQKFRVSKLKLSLSSSAALIHTIKRIKRCGNTYKFNTVLLGTTPYNSFKVYESKNELLPQLLLKVSLNKFSGLLQKFWVVPFKHVYVFVNLADKTVNVIYVKSYSSIWLAWEQIDLIQYTKLSSASKSLNLSKKHSRLASGSLNTMVYFNAHNYFSKSYNFIRHKLKTNIKNNLFKYLAFKAKFNPAIFRAKTATPPKLPVRRHRFYFKRFSNNWHSNARKNLKRFKSRYHFPKLRHRKLPVQFFNNQRLSKLVRLLLSKHKKKILKLHKHFKSGMRRRRRLKNIFKKFPVHPRWQKKRFKNPLKKHKHLIFASMLTNRYVSSKKQGSTYKFVKRPTCFSFVSTKALRKWQTIKTLPLYHKFNKHGKAPKRIFFKPLVKKVKLAKIYNLSKINMLQRMLVKKKKLKKKASKAVRLHNSKVALKKINKQIIYKLKWLNYFESKAFRWKFYKKRWYFSMSRWKRLAEFRRMLRKAWRSYRKLQKNFLFIKLLRANFHYIMGIKESELLQVWYKIRRSNNLDNATSPVNYLHQSLQLKMDNLAVFLGLAPNRLMAQELVHFGGLRVNGMVVTKKNYSMNLNDMLQIDSKVNLEIQSLYKSAHWKAVRARLSFTSFLQVQWSIMLFMMVHWPQSHEIVSRSMLNLRWVRFFIRYFPVRISKYQKAKIKWYKY